jgi:catechol 2,3-dioxygenase-like lactoylglutathione lyase family enzyme
MGVNMDCADAKAMAEFYCRLLEWEIRYQDDDYIAIGDPAGGVGLSFQEEAWYQPPVWPEQPGEQTKMIHLDIEVDDLSLATAFAVALGARLAEQQARDDLRVMFDPAGHPFCLCLNLFVAELDVGPPHRPL